MLAGAELVDASKPQGHIQCAATLEHCVAATRKTKYPKPHCSRQQKTQIRPQQPKLEPTHIPTNRTTVHGRVESHRAMKAIAAVIHLTDALTDQQGSEEVHMTL